MFEKLQKKWKVSARQVLLILIIFALGGSLTGFLGRKFISLIDIESALFFIIIYSVLITVLWPAMVLLISIPFGQFSFFRHYISGIGRRLSGKRKA